MGLAKVLTALPVVGSFVPGTEGAEFAKEHAHKGITNLVEGAAGIVRAGETFIVNQGLELGSKTVYPLSTRVRKVVTGADQKVLNAIFFRGNPTQDVGMPDIFYEVPSFIIPFSEFTDNQGNNSALQLAFQAELNGIPSMASKYKRLYEFSNSWLLEAMKKSIGDEDKLKAFLEKLNKDSIARVRFNLILRQVIDRFLQIFDMGVSQYYPLRAPYSPGQERIAIAVSTPLNKQLASWEQSQFRHRMINLRDFGMDWELSTDVSQWVDAQGNALVNLPQLRTQLGVTPMGEGLVPNFGGDNPNTFYNQIFPNLLQNLVENSPAYAALAPAEQFVIREELKVAIFDILMRYIDPLGLLRNKFVSGTARDQELRAMGADTTGQQISLAMEDKDKLEVVNFPGIGLLPDGKVVASIKSLEKAIVGVKEANEVPEARSSDKAKMLGVAEGSLGKPRELTDALRTRTGELDDLYNAVGMLQGTQYGQEAMKRMQFIIDVYIKLILKVIEDLIPQFSTMPSDLIPNIRLLTEKGLFPNHLWKQHSNVVANAQAVANDQAIRDWFVRNIDPLAPQQGQQPRVHGRQQATTEAFAELVQEVIAA